MLPTPQALIFVFTELWSPSQVEALVCGFWPPGVPPAHLQALLTSPPHDHTPYLDQLVDVATNLVMAGHQRSLLQILQEMGYLPMPGPLPLIQVFLLLFPFFLFALAVRMISESSVWKQFYRYGEGSIS
jgi:hypothetical protein